MRVLEKRFEQVVSENEKLRYENGKLRGELTIQGDFVLNIKTEIDEMKQALKKESAEKSALLNQMEDIKRSSNTTIVELQDENERLSQQ